MNQFEGFSKDTVSFFTDIKTNNTKPWFEENRKQFQQEVQQRGQAFVMAMDEAIKSISPELGGDPRLNGSGSIFRLFRDVRFSKDKTPYKTHLGILFWDPKRKKMEGPGFYFHMEPPFLTLYCGLYAFPKEIMSGYRESVSHKIHGPALLSILEKGKQNGFEMCEPHYKRYPAGFDASGKQKDLLLYNTMYFKHSQPIPDVFYSSDLVGYCLGIWTEMKPLYVWLKENVFK